MKAFLPRPLLPLLAAFLALAALQPAAAQVYISEFLADNQLNTKLDEDGDHSDWLELWNSGASAVNLNGWYLTDEAGDLRKWQFPLATPAVNLAANARIVIYASNKNRRLDATKLHTNFKLAKNAGSYLALVRANGLTVEHAYNGYPQQVQDIAYGIVVQTQLMTLLPAGAAGKALVPLSATDLAAGWNISATFDDSAWQSGQAGFGYDTTGDIAALIGPGGDLQTAMHNVNSTALVRFVFDATNLAAITSLKLSMKFDDGFNCYLNGTLIQQSGALGTAWNSTASSDRAGSLTGTFTVFNPTNAQQRLVAGANVLAIQILNSSNGSVAELDSAGNLNGARTLCLPLLEANVTIGIGPPTYLASATPGLVNSAAITALGPSISQTIDSPPRPVGGAGSAPITITTKVVPSLKPLAVTNPVQLKYAVMFNTEVSVPMKDDGVVPDAIAGDTIFTAQIPTTTMTGGQMLRWRVEAKDNANATSTSPPYRDTTDNDRYFGTVALDGITTSQLPILHWFVQNTAASQTDAGTRCSLYFLGNFYDNVFVDLHGQSSAGFSVVKKSHNFNFSEDNRFKWKEGEGRQRAINLITTWADKSHVRDTMSWESWALTKHIAAHWAQLSRVQQNGVFWGIYDMVENGDEDFLERAGLDPYGALYKVYNSLQDTSGVEKKTRDGDLSTADLQALITGMDNANPIANRRRYAYDNLDVPALVNYLATNVMTINNDFGHKNYYIYRDTNGTREWSLLPWDQDLSLGHTWTSSQNYFNDDIDSQRGLVLGASEGNRVMNLISSNNTSTIAPEMAQMFLRRLRTVMDELLVSATATNGPFEQRMNQLLDLMDPPGAAYLTDADLDFQKWGYWIDGSGAAISMNNTFDAATHDHGPRRSAMRILSSNPNPPYPTAVSNAEGLGNTTQAFLPGRRQLLYNGNQRLNSQPIPAAQPLSPTGLTIEYVEANPASGKQDQEFFIIRNNSGIYVDISGWKIEGAVNFTFHGGTVIPPFIGNGAVNATGDVHAGRLHVTRHPYEFRLRTTSPKANEYRLVTGPYSGQLSARGETIDLVKPGPTPEQDVVMATTTYAATPTAAQSFLRVTEVNFNPIKPTPAESAALVGVAASDFEFIEFINTGATPLNLGGVAIDKGVTFTFPANFMLQPGQRCVVVSLLAAYNLRYPGSGAIVAGQYEGNLANDGESIQLIDAMGESILQFKYDPLWFGVPSAPGSATLAAVEGYSLVARTDSPAWDRYEIPTTWALSDSVNGTPGVGDAAFANSYAGWSKSYFTPFGEASPTYGGVIGDPEEDGRSNFEEYVFGGHPLVDEQRPLPVASIVSVDGTDYLAITFNRRHNMIDTLCVAEASGDLSNWAPASVPVGAPTALGDGIERVTYRDNEPFVAGQRFLRVRATR